ncbi:MAG: inorganic phosphate transporter [Allorhizobium sp.]
MAKATPKLVKPTLDKDLDKFSLVEEAAQQVSRGFASLGVGFLFLVVAMIFAGTYVVNLSGGAMVIAAAAIGAYMAMNIGANDVTNNVGAAVGARAMSMTTALVIAAIFEIAGAMIGGDDVVTTISAGILDPAQALSPEVYSWAMMAALLAAALWINLSSWIGAPVSTTHSIVGSVMGAGVAASGLSAVNWTSMAGIAASWMLSPLLGGIVAIAMLAFIKEFIIYRQDKIAAARRWVPVLIAVMAGTFATYLTIKGARHLIDVSTPLSLLFGLTVGIITWILCIPMIRRQAAGLENRNQSLRLLFRWPLICSAALLSFAHGANDVANAIGPVTAIVHATRFHQIGSVILTPSWVLVIGAFGISMGLLLFGPRLIRLVGGQITKLNPMRAYCVALSAALTVILASSFGLPVSSTHIAVGAVFAVGFFREWYTRHSGRRIEYMQRKAERFKIEAKPERNVDERRRRYLVRRSHFMTIVAAWVITVPMSAGLAAILYVVMFRLFV